MLFRRINPVRDFPGGAVMTLSHLNRRAHLYFALTFAPWFLMYGVSSYAFNHNDFFEARDKAKGEPLWLKRFEKSYEIAIPAEGSLKAVGKKIMDDNGLAGSFGTYRQSPNQLNVYIYTFWKSTQVKYFINEKKLVAEDRRFRLEHFLTGMHAKGGFEQEGFLNGLWSVIVDLVCIGMAGWVFTGLIMWWQLPSTRRWGWLAVVGGIGSFGIFLARL
jgi:hypothetical protein